MGDYTLVIEGNLHFHHLCSHLGLQAILIPLFHITSSTMTGGGGFSLARGHACEQEKDLASGAKQGEKTRVMEASSRERMKVEGMMGEIYGPKVFIGKFGDEDSKEKCSDR